MQHLGFGWTFYESLPNGLKLTFLIDKLSQNSGEGTGTPHHHIKLNLEFITGVPGAYTLLNENYPTINKNTNL